MAVNFILLLSQIESSFLFRCPCYGNDDNCVVNSLTGDYTCSCSLSSNTSGAYCDTCRDEFYKMAIDQPCEHTCDCHSFGSDSNKCSKVRVHTQRCLNFNDSCTFIFCNVFSVSGSQHAQTYEKQICLDLSKLKRIITSEC